MILNNDIKTKKERTIINNNFGKGQNGTAIFRMGMEVQVQVVIGWVLYTHYSTQYTCGIAARIV